MPESSPERAACQLARLCRSATLTRLKCDIKFLHGLTVNTVLFSSRGCCRLQPTHQKTLQDFTEPQEAECLFMEIRYACVCPAYSSFSSIFFVCQESSQECPLMQCISLDIFATLLHAPLFCI